MSGGVSMNELITFKDVVKEYGTGESKQVAVNHVDFTIDEGEFVVILGQSGAGKSTVLNMLGGMDQPTSGSIRINGENASLSWCIRLCRNWRRSCRYKGS
jgi:putative ABC transport system ATP-binding protein